jgi:hypothetical protein
MASMAKVSIEGSVIEKNATGVYETGSTVAPTATKLEFSDIPGNCQRAQDTCKEDLLRDATDLAKSYQFWIIFIHLICIITIILKFQVFGQISSEVLRET